jgi:hypothetical protein
MTPKLEVLAQELETLRDGKGMRVDDLIKKARNDDYPRESMVRDLGEAHLKFFAEKLATGYYELNIEKDNNA